MLLDMFLNGLLIAHFADGFVVQPEQIAQDISVIRAAAFGGVVLEAHRRFVE